MKTDKILAVKTVEEYLIEMKPLPIKTPHGARKERSRLCYYLPEGFSKAKRGSYSKGKSIRREHDKTVISYIDQHTIDKQYTADNADKIQLDLLLTELETNKGT